jgi:uncharacterized protein YhaN
VRIAELYLDGFGHFSKRQIGPLTQPITIIYGPNEAGKSTLLSFIRAMLFGFPFRYTSYYPPLAGGRHGGRITLVDDAGQAFVIERYSWAGGAFGIKTIGGSPLDGKGVLNRLLGQASPDTFKSVFAFSLDELQNGKILEEDGVKRYIYSAGLGVPGLPDLLKSLSDKKSEIFRPYGRSQKVTKLLADLGEVDQQLKAVEGNAARYSNLVARREEIQRQLEEADSRRTGLAARLAEVENLRRGWEDWIALVGCEKSLNALPQFRQFPEDPIPRLENYRERTRQAREDRNAEALCVQQAEQAAQAQIANEDLLEDRDRIESIRRGRSSFDASVRDLPERKAELGALEADLRGKLRDLSYSWNETTLEAFDTSLAVRNEVEQWKQALTDNRNAAQQAQFQLAQDENILQRLQADESEARQKLQETDKPSLDANAPESRHAALRTSRSTLDEYERVRQNHSNLAQQLSALTGGYERKAGSSGLSSFGFPLILGLTGIALVAAGALLGQPALLLGFIAGVLLLGVAAYLLVKGRSVQTGADPQSDTLRRQVNAARDSAEAAAKALKEAVSPLDFPLDSAELPDAAALDNLEVELETAARTLQAWNEVNGRLAEAARKLRAQEQRVDHARAERDRIASSNEAAQLEWQGWLQAHNLPGSFTPDTMIEFLGRVDTARAKLEQVRQMRHRVAAIQKDIDDYSDLVQPLARKHEVKLEDESYRGIGAVADTLIEKLDTVRDLMQQRDEARRQLEEHQRQLEQRERRWREAEATLGELLAAGGAEDPEEFRHRARQHAEHRELEQRPDEHLSRLQLLSGPGHKLEAFREALSRADPQETNEEGAQLSRQISEIDAGRNSLLEERGSVEAQLKQLTSEEESSALRVPRNALLEQLREQAREWARLTLAEELLERARQKFERERQPGVIQHAQSFFCTVTERRYGHLYAPVGEQTIKVIDQVGASKQPAELSRGTREQLYLALRFGLIREFGQHAERLPVVIDEILVDFDPERARRAVEAFAELAQTNQLLVFTCHPATVDMFNSVVPDAQVIQLQDFSAKTTL